MALLLEGEATASATAEALATYHAAPFRPPAFAGSVYPSALPDLIAHLMAFDMAAGAEVLPPDRVCGVLTPHIDFARGSRIYAQAWRQARDAVRDAEQVILLGTDHCGSRGSLTLTSQHYATPWGTFDDDPVVRDAVAAAFGEEAAYADELHHRTEHSAELAAVWLHHVRNGKSVLLTPVLCGPPGPALDYSTDGPPGANSPTSRALGVLRSAVAEGAFVVVAGDLAHVGPAFGDPQAFEARELEQVREADMALVAACGGGAGAMLAASARAHDRYRVCGLGPLAVALAIMPPVALELVDYAQCPADAGDSSFVSVAGGCFVRRTAGLSTSGASASLGNGETECAVPEQRRERPDGV